MVKKDNSFVESAVNRATRKKKIDEQSSPPPDGVPTITLSELAKCLGCTRPTIYRAIGSGKLRTFKDGDNRVTTQEEIARWQGPDVAAKTMSAVAWVRHGDYATDRARKEVIEPLLKENPGTVVTDAEIAKAVTMAVERVLDEEPTNREVLATIAIESFQEVLGVEG